MDLFAIIGLILIRVSRVRPKPRQKAAQRDNAGMQDLMEICCLWAHVEADLLSYIGKGPEFDKVAGMWEQGCLGYFKFISTYSWAYQKETTAI